MDTRFNAREHNTYIRYLELCNQITEDWGKVVNGVNDYINKGRNPEAGLESLELITKMSSPIKELEALLRIELSNHLNTDNES